MSDKAISFLKFLFFGLVPPEHPDDWTNAEQLMKWRKAKVRWRKFVAGALWIGAALFLFLVPAVYGLLPPKFDRIAWAEDVKEEVKKAVEPLKEEVKDIKKSIVKQDEAIVDIKETLDDQDEADLLQAILQAKNEQCTAAREGRSATYWSSQLATLRARYIAITGHDDTVPLDCGKF